MENLISSEALKAVLLNPSNTKGAQFTIKSKATQKEFTYKIVTKKFKGKYYHWISVEVRYQEWLKLGSYFNGHIWDNKKPNETQSAKGIAWVLSLVEADDVVKVDKHYEVYHTGHCIKCGKPLTDSNSIKKGIGPVCAKY